MRIFQSPLFSFRYVSKTKINILIKSSLKLDIKRGFLHRCLNICFQAKSRNHHESVKSQYFRPRYTTKSPMREFKVLSLTSIELVIILLRCWCKTFLCFNLFNKPLWPRTLLHIRWYLRSFTPLYKHAIFRLILCSSNVLLFFFCFAF